MKKNLVLIFFSFVFAMFFLNFSFAAVEVFSNYDTILTINSNNTININKSLTLKNVYDVGIVPGQIEFKIGKGTDGSVQNIDISNIVAFDSFGNKIKSQLRETKDYSIIILDVYYPLLPGFEYKFKLDYTISYKSGGIFFKSLRIPLRESTIPINKGNFQVILPDNYYFTYLDSEGVEGSIKNNIASWNIKNDLPKSVVFEYSYLPVSLFGFKGSYVFWIFVNIVLLLVLFYEIRKEIKRVRSEYE